MYNLLCTCPVGISGLIPEHKVFIIPFHEKALPFLQSSLCHEIYFFSGPAQEPEVILKCLILFHRASKPLATLLVQL